MEKLRPCHFELQDTDEMLMLCLKGQRGRERTRNWLNWEAENGDRKRGDT